MSSDPSRWAFLNESEREMLRHGLAWRDNPRGSLEELELGQHNLLRAAMDLTDDDPAPGVIEMPHGWRICPSGIVASHDVDAHLDTDGGQRVINLHDGECSLSVPLPVAAQLLRAAGWRVEGPRG